MLKKLMAAAAFVALFSLGTAAQDARTVIGNASKAMGADNLKTIEYSGTGSDFALGQAPNPGAPWPRFIDKTYTRAINWLRLPAWTDPHAGENPPRGGGQHGPGTAPERTIVSSANTPWVSSLIWMTLRFPRAAAASNAATVKARTVGGRNKTS